MDHLHERLDALEQQVHTLTQHTHTVTRRLRWWRGLACGLAVLGLLSWGLPLGLAKDEAHDKDEKKLEHRVAALEKLLRHLSREGNEITITGANLHIVNGLGATETTNGLGNLIVGYNELRVGEEVENIRTGSHTIVVGREHNFSSYGGIVIGRINTTSGPFASITAGQENTASGFGSSISGGYLHESLGEFAAVCGGTANTASGHGSSVSGGEGGKALGQWSSVSGGSLNMALGLRSSVSGGSFNTASGDASSVSGGVELTQETGDGWAAGSGGDEVFVGNFRSP